MDSPLPYFAVTAVVGGVLLAPLVWLAGRPSGRELPPILAGLGFLLGACAGSLMLMAIAAAVFVATLFAVWVHKPHIARWGVALAGIVAGLFTATTLWQGVSRRAAEIDDLRARFPPQSVAERLSYEEAARPQREQQGIVLADPVAARLTSHETSHHSYRAHMLERLHSDNYRTFATQVGFGVSRMRWVRPDDVELPPEQPIRCPEAPPQPPPYPVGDASPAELASLDAIGNELAQVMPGPSAGRLEKLHDAGVFDFTDPDSLGYVRDRTAVYGFESHRIGSPLPLDDEAAPATERWQISRLELVSLLKHESPAVYVSDDLPAMDELADVPTRPLDEFEAGALPRLDTEEDVVIDSDLNQIRMLGALRASSTCLECHQARRAELLGAFSYVLHRVEPVAPTGAVEPEIVQ
jgi:hypothetical protein